MATQCRSLFRRSGWLHLPRAAAVLLHALLVTTATAEERIRFNYLKAVNPTERSALSGECDGDDSATQLTCRFTQLMVRYQLDPKDLDKETRERLSQLRAEVGNDVKKFSGELCGDIRNSAIEVQQKLEELKDSAALRQLQELRSLCANPSLKALEDWVRRMTFSETKVCRVSVFQNDPVKFKRVNEHKWVGNVGPHGMCSAVYLYTLERDPQHTSLWTWSQVRTYADTSLEFCKDLQLNYKLEYSWKGRDIPMNCESIQFGP